MSDTTQLFILAGIWTLAAAILVYFIKKWPARIIVFALLVGIPFWELPFGYLNFRALCNEQGGLHVFDKIAPQHQICLKSPIEYLAPQFLGNGINTVETIDRIGKRRLVTKSGEIGHTSPTIYCVTQEFVQGLPWRTQRNEFAIVKATDQRVVARSSDFVWYGTWWQQAALPVLGRGGECRHGNPTPAIARLLVEGSN
jgi:hypothetical protein